MLSKILLKANFEMDGFNFHSKPVFLWQLKTSDRRHTSSWQHVTWPWPIPTHLTHVYDNFHLSLASYSLFLPPVGFSTSSPCGILLPGLPTLAFIIHSSCQSLAFRHPYTKSVIVLFAAAFTEELPQWEWHWCLCPWVLTMGVPDTPRSVLLGILCISSFIFRVPFLTKRYSPQNTWLVGLMTTGGTLDSMA